MILPPLLLLALAATACGGPRGPGPAEIEPLLSDSAAPAPLPDEAEQTAARIAELALAGRVEAAAARLEELRALDDERRSAGRRETGLGDNALDLLAAARGRRAYTSYARRMLETGTPDAALRRRLVTHLESQPLERAERRLGEHRRRRTGALVNRLVAPLSRLVSGGPLNPIETGRAALAALLVMRSFPAISTQERQALRAYQEFLDREPDAPEAEWVRARVRRYGDKLTRALHAEALRFAAQAVEAGRPDAALVHLDRAARIAPGDASGAALRDRATRDLEAQRAAIARSLEASPTALAPATRRERDAESALARALLSTTLDEAARRARDWTGELEGSPLEDEVAFVSAFEPRARGSEDEFFERLEEIADLDLNTSNMARHALYILGDPAQNPYAHYRAAVRADRRARLAWLLLGRHARGASRRGLPRAAEWLLDLPGFAASIVSAPLRLIRYPSARAKFGAAVLDTGERYLARFPDGAHPNSVHRDLERRYAKRHQWSQALAHHRARPGADDGTIARYRERLADRTLDAAALHPRIDVRAAIFRSVAVEYAETPQAARAREALAELVATATPQGIRVSRAFLEENPQVWERGALGLRPELFDGDAGNGELAAEGVTLLGQTRVRIALVDRPSMIDEVPADAFGRFVSLLEEASYRRLVTDERERPEPDPQRDLFFERARLGLLSRADPRPAASSQAVFLGTREKHGFARRPGSILPVEIVLQGGLEDFGLAAFPRIKLPAETPDAFLYR